MVFKESATKVLKISRMVGDEYVPTQEDPDTIMTDVVPLALSIVHVHLATSTFCDRFSTPLSTLAHQVAIIEVYLFCNYNTDEREMLLFE